MLENNRQVEEEDATRFHGGYICMTLLLNLKKRSTLFYSTEQEDMIGR